MLHFNGLVLVLVSAGNIVSTNMRAVVRFHGEKEARINFSTALAIWRAHQSNFYQYVRTFYYVELKCGVTTTTKHTE